MRAHDFYEKHGGKTIIIARFMPIVRTFAPVVAGVGNMEYRRFLSFNVFGGALWVLSMTLIGYFLGQIPGVKEHIEIVILVVVFLSILPGIIAGALEWWKKCVELGLRPLRGPRRRRRSLRPSLWSERTYLGFGPGAPGAPLGAAHHPDYEGHVGAVRAVVVGHHPRDVGERDSADALLGTGALPVGPTQVSERLEILTARPGEERQGPVEIPLLIRPFPGDPVPVEVRQHGILLGEDSANSEAEALALEVRQMPHVLDERKGLLVRPPAGVGRRERRRCPGQERGCGLQSEQKRLEFPAFHHGLAD